MRFIALQDPTDNWMVYDQLSETPADFSGGVLFGLSREEAEHLTTRANTKFASYRISAIWRSLEYFPPRNPSRMPDQ